MTLLIKLSSNEQLVILIENGGEIELGEGDNVGQILRRVLKMQARSEAERVGRESAPTRFYAMHLERHGGGAASDPNCEWCKSGDEGLAGVPVRRIPMGQKGDQSIGRLSDQLAEELGL